MTDLTISSASLHELAASPEGTAEQVRTYLQAGDVADLINGTNGRGQTPLHCAIEARNIETALALLKFKPKLEVGDYIGRTPLYVAVEEYVFSDYEMMRVIFALKGAGADSKAPTHSGMTPMDLGTAYREKVKPPPPETGGRLRAWGGDEAPMFDLLEVLMVEVCAGDKDHLT